MNANDAANKNTIPRLGLCMNPPYVTLDRAGEADYARGGSKGAEPTTEGTKREIDVATAREIAGASMFATLGRTDNGIEIVKPKSRA
jgi:hypothetical protein